LIKIKKVCFKVCSFLDFVKYLNATVLAQDSSGNPFMQYNGITDCRIAQPCMVILTDKVEHPNKKNASNK
jgi:hypothetical protein